MENYGIKRKKTVIDWILENLIPGANLEEDFIPDSARPPYTKARAKNAKAIYYSIVVASSKRYHVFPRLYGICEEEFNGYIDRLVAANLIAIRITDDIVYYDATIAGVNINRQFVFDAIELCSRGISQGITAAVLQQ